MLTELLLGLICLLLLDEFVERRQIARRTKRVARTVFKRNK